LLDAHLRILGLPEFGALSSTTSFLSMASFLYQAASAIASTPKVRRLFGHQFTTD